MDQLTIEITAADMELAANALPPSYNVDVSNRLIGENDISLSIWRIEEDSSLEAVPRRTYGTFVDDGAYLVYACCPIDTFINQDAITHEAKSGTVLERSLHLWLGGKVSSQKRAQLEYKVKQLDSRFANVAAEYREVQNRESARFLSYFKRGLIVNSSARPSSQKSRLYKFCAQNWTRCTEMDHVNWAHFGSHHVMLLHAEKNVFVWVGRFSNNAQRRGAVDLAHRWQSEHSRILIVDDGYEQSLPEQYKAVWNTLLPVEKRVVVQSCCVSIMANRKKMEIYQCTYHAGSTDAILQKIDATIPTKEVLTDSTRSYVLDCAPQAVWVWVGSQVVQQNVVNVLNMVCAFLQKQNYDASTPIIRAVEGHEPIEFIRLFPNWHHDWNDTTMSYRPMSSKLGKLDPLTLCRRPKMAADTQLIDDGTGKRTIFCSSRNPIQEIAPATLMVFSMQNSYVVRYTVAYASSLTSDMANVGIHTVIYQWNGSRASAEVISEAERFALGWYESFDEKAMYVQLCQWDETPHFLQIFDGKLAVVQEAIGQRPNENTTTTNDSLDVAAMVAALIEGRPYLFQIYGDASYNSKALEISPSPMSSKGCYVIKMDNVWVWCGVRTMGDAREVAKSFGGLLGEFKLILEGNEPPEFWHSVNKHFGEQLLANNNAPNNPCGIGAAIPCGSYLAVNTKKTSPQALLFHVSAVHEKYFLQEIMAYEQNDLWPECLYILDAGIITYIWLGANASSHDKERCLKMLLHYLQTVPIERGPARAVAVVKQESEPNVFKGFFEKWDNDFWQGYISHEQITQLCRSDSEVNVLERQKQFNLYHKYPLAELQVEVALLPAGVDPLSREKHLTHDDFVAAFKMPYWQYETVPEWRKQQLKKANKLF